jgi:hypothetical protein
MKPNNFSAGSFLKPNDSLIYKTFSNTQNQGVLLLPGFWFQVPGTNGYYKDGIPGIPPPSPKKKPDW